jgi:hypothetical protein
VKRIVKVTIVVGIVIGILLAYPIWVMSVGPSVSKNLVSEYLAKQPIVNVTGTIDHWQPIDGPSYALIPEEELHLQLDNGRLYLYGDVLTDSLDEKRVTIIGTLIENFRDYKSATLKPIFGGDPNSAVIFVNDVKILQELP